MKETLGQSKTATTSIDWPRFSVLQQKGEQHFRIRVCRNEENMCNSSKSEDCRVMIVVDVVVVVGSGGVLMRDLCR